MTVHFTHFIESGLNGMSVFFIVDHAETPVFALDDLAKKEVRIVNFMDVHLCVGPIRSAHDVFMRNIKKLLIEIL